MRPYHTKVDYVQLVRLGRMQGLGFMLQQEASLKTLTANVVKSSAIEGEQLNPEQVRSSLAQKLGIDVGGFTPTSCDVEGIVEIMIDTTANFDKTLTVERLFDCSRPLPPGRSGLGRINIVAWRPASVGPMQIVSGPMDRGRRALGGWLSVSCQISSIFIHYTV